MRLTLLAVVAGAFVALAGEPPPAAKDEKAPPAPGEDKTLIIQNGKEAEAKKSATGTDNGKKALIIQNGKGAKAKKK